MNPYHTLLQRIRTGTKHRRAHAAHLRGAESPNVRELW